MKCVQLCQGCVYYPDVFKETDSDTDRLWKRIKMTHSEVYCQM